MATDEVNNNIREASLQKEITNEIIEEIHLNLKADSCVPNAFFEIK